MENAIMVAAALIGAGLCMGFAAIGAGLGDGLVTSRFIEGITRQPEAQSKLFTNTLISVGLLYSKSKNASLVALHMHNNLPQYTNCDGRCPDHALCQPAHQIIFLFDASRVKGA